VARFPITIFLFVDSGESFQNPPWMAPSGSDSTLAAYISLPVIMLLSGLFDIFFTI
jgi:hypothetical protein